MARLKTDIITEGEARIRVPEGVFFNPEMKFCRDLSVLVVRATMEGKKARTVEATAGTGVRGIRYSKECGNAVGELFLVDLSPAAVKSALANLKLSNVKGRPHVVRATFARFANSIHAKGGFGIVEVDPFGTPVPFLYDACRVSRDGTLLSVTATDTAVLCGAHPKACVKNYHAKPLNPFMCHEVGARILLGKVARNASEFNYGVKPLLTLSHLHYFKLFALLEDGAEKAVASVKETGFLAHCNKCLHRVFAKGVAHSLPEKCENCGERMELVGPLWLGELHSNAVLEKVLELDKVNAKKGNGKATAVSKLVSLMLEENGMPAFYFELHRVTEKMGVNAVSTDGIVAALKKKGFKVSHTHFQVNSLKTDAPVWEVENAIGKKPKRKIYK